MTTKTLYPQKITQTSQTNTSYREFNNLSNLKNNKSSYAKTGQIASKTGTHYRPSKLTATKFKAQIPAGSKINSITVQYAADYEGNISIGKSTVDLINVSVAAKNGKALTKTLTQSPIKFTGSFNVNSVNHDNFGVTISFPANTKADVGYVKLQYIRIVIDYTAPNFSLTASKVDGVYTDDEFKVKANISNVGKTSSSPNVTITLPQGVTYIGKDSGEGSVTGSGSSLTWKPSLSTKKLNASIVLKVSINTNGNHNIKFSENVSSHSKTLNINTTTRPNYDDSAADDQDDSKKDSVNIGDLYPDAIPITVYTSQMFSIDITRNELNSQSGVGIGSNAAGIYYASPSPYDLEPDEFDDMALEINPEDSSDWYEDYAEIPSLDFERYSHNNIYSQYFKICTHGQYYLALFPLNEYAEDETIIYKITVKPSPDTLTRPNLTIFQLGEEECNRLGDGIVYTIQSYIKHVTNDTYARDWDKEFRIGVMNNINPNIDAFTIITDTEIIDGDEVTVEPIESMIIDPTDYDRLTPLEIFDYAEYWSQALTSVNAWESLTCEFVYNKNYPVYVIITGDYPQGSQSSNSINYTEPCIIESDTYNGWETNGNYPYPIENLLSADKGFSEISIGSFEKSNEIIFYNLPLHEYLNEDDIVKGISLSLDIEKTDALLINVKLRHPNGQTHERSVLTHPYDNSFSVGGSTDRWGFSDTDFKTVGDWEIEITIDNNYITDMGISVESINNAVVTVYYGNLKKHVVQTFVEGENLSAYGFFLQKLKIPEGLETDTKSLNNDGTDLNEIYRQNITEKNIEIEFSIRGCDIAETTQLFREFISLIVNERSSLNKPIPKRIEFSSYPDVYWEYVMKKAVDYEVTVSSFTGKLELTVPAGTAFAKNETATGRTGCVEGLAKVNPVITLIPLSNNIGLEEIVSGQKFNINYSDWNANTTVNIDCSNRTVTLYKDDETIDLTGQVDINCDWFLLGGEFIFEETDCILQSVTWTERR